MDVNVLQFFELQKHPDAAIFANATASALPF